MPSPDRQINLMRGWPSPDVLPASLLSAASQHILNDKTRYTTALQYGPNEGHWSLREGMAQWLARHYAVQPDPKRICITGGASQGLACILQSFSDVHYTRAVWLVAPCYYLACGIFHDFGFAGRLKAVPEDDEGIDLETLEREINNLDQQAAQGKQPEPLKKPGPARKLYRHVIYVVPTSSNPSGKTMSLRRREGLVRLARAHDALVVCDDVYDFLQWPLQQDLASAESSDSSLKLPRLCDLDRAMGPAEGDDGGFCHAVSNGSFSKIAGPGLRTGWVEGSPAFAKGLGNTASTLSGGAPSQFCAAMLGYLVQTGDLERHVNAVLRPSLQRRHRLITDAICEFLRPLGFETRGSSLAGAETYGGYFVWLTPNRREMPSAKLIADLAQKEENLIIGHGRIFEVRGDEHRASFGKEIRLCYAWESEADLVDGVKRLASLLKRMQRGQEEHDEEHV